MVLDKSIEEDKIEEMIENEPEKIESMIQEKLYGKTSVKLDNTLSDIREKVRDIKMVEKSVINLLTMIHELHLILSSSSSLINSIDHNMSQVKDHIEHTVDNIDQSNKLMVSANEKLWCIFFVITLVSVFVVNFIMNQFV